MYAIQYTDPKESKDTKVAILVTGISLSMLILIAYFIKFLVLPTVPEDIPPLNSDEVIEEFMIDNVELQSEAGGSGGGTPTNDRIDKPTPQSEKFVTSAKSDIKVNQGNSNNHNTNNSNNTSSSTSRSDNPFGDGGTGGGAGGGTGGRFGNDSGTGANGPGGSGSGSARTRLNDPNVDHIETNVNVTVYLKLTVNEDGNVVGVSNIANKTTTTDQRIIDQVKSAVKSQVKYNRNEGAALKEVYLTVKLNAT